jgi:hypothetical protein
MVFHPTAIHFQKSSLNKSVSLLSYRNISLSIPAVLSIKAVMGKDMASGAKSTRYAQIIAAMLGMAGPVAAGVITGHAQMGAVAALGGLAASGNGKHEPFRDQARDLIHVLLAGGAAMFTGAALAGHDLLKTFCIPAIAAVAGLVGGISRPLVRATTLFILYIIIAANLGLKDFNPVGTMLLFFLGVLWSAALSLGLSVLFRKFSSNQFTDKTASAVQPVRPTMQQLLRRWRRTLEHLSGWQYALRITLCLMAAEVFEWLWPHHHGHWALITIMLVVQRDLQAAMRRTIQRATGTVLGVALISLLLLTAPPAWIMIAVIAALAAARPIFRATNYTAYAVFMTPLIILLMEFRQEISWIVITDRLIATFVGCTIAFTLGYLIWIKRLSTVRIGKNGAFNISGKKR